MHENTSLWPLIWYFFAVVVLAGIMIGLPRLLGERHRGRVTGEPYESGIPPTGNARLRFSAQFYLIGLFFVIFDLEAVFIYGWAIAWRDVGWTGYIEVLIFISVLAASLAYLWKLGALEWRKTKHGVEHL